MVILKRYFPEMSGRTLARVISRMWIGRPWTKSCQKHSMHNISMYKVMKCSLFNCAKMLITIHISTYIFALIVSKLGTLQGNISAEVSNRRTKSYYLYIPTTRPQVTITSVMLNIVGASLRNENYVGDRTCWLIQLFIQPEQLLLRTSLHEHGVSLTNRELRSTAVY